MYWPARSYSSHLARSPQGPRDLASFHTAPGHGPSSWEEAAPLKDRLELAGWTRRGDNTGRGGGGRGHMGQESQGIKEPLWVPLGV